MHPNLAPFLEQVLPAVPTALCRDHQMLLGIARQLPGCPHGMLECRLAHGDGQVDFSQGFTAEDKHHLTQDLTNKPQWPTANTIISLWRASNSLSKHCPQIGLEFDCPNQLTGELREPAVFLKPRDEGGKQLSATLDAIAAAHPPSAQTIAHAKNWLPETHAISHIGLMLSRSQNLLRLQLPCRQAADWNIIPDTPASASFSALLALALPYFDGGTLCVDFTATGMAPNLAVELPIQWLNTNSHFEDFAAELVAENLATGEKLRAAKSWPGYSDPGSLVGHWQQERPTTDAMLLIKRRLSHIKLSVNATGVRQAKVYLEFYRHAVFPTKGDSMGGRD